MARQQPRTTSRKKDQPEPIPSWLLAARIAEAKKGADLKVIDLREVTSFTDYFVICTGANPRQIQAIADDILLQLKQRGEHTLNTEGYENAEWVLLDYGDFLVHIFSEKARRYYDLERLWRHARVVEIPEARPEDTRAVNRRSAPRS